MSLQGENILYFTRTMQLGGTENVVLQLCEIFGDKVNKIVVCSCGGVNVEKLKKMGITHYDIPDISGKNPISAIKTILRLRKIVKREKITIIHTHHRMAAFYVSMLRMYKKCVFMNTSHNTFYDKKSLTQMAYKNANLIACGKMVKKNLVDFYELPSERIEAITNAVKPFEGKVVEEAFITDLHNKEYFVVGNIGRLSEQKGMEYYIKAIPIILKSCPKMHFLIVGEGEDRGKLESLIDELKIYESVTFMGYRADVQNIISQLDLVVLSSLWEGFPLTPIETFSVGKTIVATAVDGTVEIVEDGKNGFLVEKASAEQIADKIIYMYNNRDILTQMEKEALSTYNKQLSFDIFKTHYVDYYEKCIETNG